MIDTAEAKPLGEENKGFKMLQAMGWGGSGGGLGAMGQGTATPLSVQTRQGRTGLGHLDEGGKAWGKGKGSELLVCVQEIIR